ncbi:methyltransferase domain-containing protein [Allosphingosinicella flava]|uniref:Methyltransferase domain-containing protein n=1 Tax=Allosphingosinicella flava TaxID=2771430 RepID=A0A7T2GLB2_9SPHN|nr:methyltransferase domain-containing protein [Sphingosinicella flava]QPQ55955.1 methyltransferase domain-containing protein [Sphingosinicella flava]
MSIDTPFDRALRRLRRDRAQPRFASADYLHRLAADELLDRLDLVKRDFRDVLDLGCGGGYLTGQLRARGMTVTPLDAGARFAEAAGGICADEDKLAFPPESFDLVMSVGVLDSVNDLPGALTLIRRALRPDGLFLAAFAGARSLPALRAAMMAADESAGAAAPHIHPQIDLRAAGDLLTRAGFALPVADSAAVPVRFPHLMGLVSDLRAMGATNVLANRPRRPVLKAGLLAALSRFSELADPDGKTGETFEIIYLSGWAPAPDQPQPAPRGSGRVSLADALKGAVPGRP